MTDFAAARRMMVDGQVRPSDVTDPRIVDAMLDLPRERFVPQAMRPLSYLDQNLRVTAGSEPRYLIQPRVLAKMVHLADVAVGDRVLDVGCATGYSTALLARLGRSVIGVESEPELAQQARENLAQLAPANTAVELGALAAGWPGGAPYDVVVINGAVETLPPALVAQVRDGGRIVAIVGLGPAGKCCVVTVSQGRASARAVFDASAPGLAGFEKAAEFVF